MTSDGLDSDKRRQLLFVPHTAHNALILQWFRNLWRRIIFSCNYQLHSVTRLILARFVTHRPTLRYFRTSLSLGQNLTQNLEHNRRKSWEVWFHNYCLITGLLCRMMSTFFCYNVPPTAGYLSSPVHVLFWCHLRLSFAADSTSCCCQSHCQSTR